MFYIRFFGLKHIEAHKENQDSPGNFKGGYGNSKKKEYKLAQYQKEGNDNKGRKSGLFTNVVLGLAIGPSHQRQENGHIRKRVHYGEKAREHCNTEG